MSMSHLELFAGTAGLQQHTGSDGKRTSGAQTRMHAMDGEEGKSCRFWEEQGRVVRK